MTNANDCAYPADNQTQTDGGLTKREYFAAMRAEPIFGNETLPESWAKIIMGTDIPASGTIENIQWWVEANEKFSVMKADALINALNSKLLNYGK